METPNFDDVKKAYTIIKEYAHKTPVLSSQTLNNQTGAKLFFKCENFQKVGAFKFRGATNAVFSTNEKDASRGFATHSSGNHAQALALASKMKGENAYIVMPSNAPDVKINAVRDYGAEIIFCEPTQEARESTLENVVERTGANLIHPYNNPFVIAGQGTAALELIEEIKDLDAIVAPVGGGGLLSGTAISTKALLQNAEIYGAEPKEADDAKKSFDSGHIVPSIAPKTIADGLLTSLGDLTFAVIKQNVKEILTVTEEEIISAMRLVWERMKIIIEPSSAVALASVIKNKELFAGKRVGIIFSGGNVNLTNLPF